MFAECEDVESDNANRILKHIRIVQELNNRNIVDVLENLNRYLTYAELTENEKADIDKTNQMNKRVCIKKKTVIANAVNVNNKKINLTTVSKAANRYHRIYRIQSRILKYFKYY